MPVISPATFRRLTRVAVVVLALIVVTGGAVRLTGSGLGCPTWPECGNGSFVAHPETGVHGLVEFGNRVVTVIVGLLVLALPVLALRLPPALTAPERRRRTAMVLLGFGLWVGYIGQAVLGGLTVLFHLHPALVAGHFLLSMLLLLDAVVLDVLARRPLGPPALVRREVRLLSSALTLVAAAVLLLGTVVTGSGPHAGDSTDVRRFGFDPRSVAQLHADVAMLLVGLVLATALAVRLVGKAAAVREANVLAALVVAQAAVGFIQYFTHLPVGLVGLHIAGATALWVFALRLQLSLSEPEREPVLNLDSASDPSEGMPELHAATGGAWERIP